MGSKVLVVGTGTIGEPLIGLLSDIKGEVGIEEILFHKLTPPTVFQRDGKTIDKRGDRPLVRGLVNRGAKLCVKDEKSANGFRQEGFEPYIIGTRNAVEEADVVVDCTPKGFGIQNKRDFYQDFEGNTRGFIAQGSENGFGKPYVYGVSDETLEAGKDKYLQVLSCNTHNITVLVHTLALTKPQNPLEEGRFLCIRRANDISQATKFIPSPQITFPDDKRFGTHHAKDAHRLFSLMGWDLNLFSAALKVNTQYMHALWFYFKGRVAFDNLGKNWLMEKLTNNPRIALTYKDNTGQVFSFGRDHGHYGRILNNTVVVVPSLQVRNGREVTGFCFTPQDGNSLSSSVAAVLWLLYPDDYEKRLEVLKPYFFKEV